MKTKNKVGLFCLSTLTGICFYLQALAIETRIEDIPVSVEVLPVFSISLDNPSLAFGAVKPGETEILGEGRYFNQVKCRANSGRPWFLKAQLISLGLLERSYPIPFSSLKYKIVENTGSSTQEKYFDFQEFSQQPILIYSSLGSDNKGKEVTLRFQYSLTAPSNAPPGTYAGQIIYTMTESP